MLEEKNTMDKDRRKGTVFRLQIQCSRLGGTLRLQIYLPVSLLVMVGWNQIGSDFFFSEMYLHSAVLFERRLSCVGVCYCYCLLQCFP